ncbi:MAG: hypothetical protein ACMG51_01155 [Ginsengibacter sp.]
MQTKYLLLLVFVFVLGSCSTAYRTGQTPDDVYYSPEPTNDGYVTQNNQDDRDSYGYRNSEESDIRQGIRNPILRNSVSLGIGMGYDPYNSFGYAPSFGGLYGYNSFGYNPYYSNSYGYNSFGYNNFYSPYNYTYLNGFNYNGSYMAYPYYSGHSGYYENNYGYYQPYYSGLGTVNTNRGVRRMNGVSSNYGNYNPGSNGYTPAPIRTFPTQQRPSSGVGNAIRRVFSPGSNSSNSNSRSMNTRTFNNNRTTQQSTPTRDFNSSSNSGSSSSGNSSGSAPARVFRK